MSTATLAPPRVQSSRVDPAAPARNPEAVVQSALADVSHIATLPEVTDKIIRLVEEPTSTAADLHRVITHDPALGARILKVVNSAFYGLPGQIGSMERAVVLLGLNAVKNIAVAASLSKLFRGDRIGQGDAGFSARDLWSHSLATAAGTRLLAGEVGLKLPDEAFVAGLMHDIGIMVEIQACRPAFEAALAKLAAEPHLTLRQAEAACVGATHEQFGAGLCRLWKFPTSFAVVAGFHHRPWDLPANARVLPSLVYVADLLSERVGCGLLRGSEPTQPRPEVLTELNLSPVQLDRVVKALPAAIEEAKGVFAG